MAVVWESLWSNFNRETFNKLYKSEIAYLKILLNSRNIFGMTFLFCLQFLLKLDILYSVKITVVERF
jgi:hypothetical protein